MSKLSDICWDLRSLGAHGCSVDCTAEEWDEIDELLGYACFYADLEAADGACEFLDTDPFGTSTYFQECQYDFLESGTENQQQCNDFLESFDSFDSFDDADFSSYCVAYNAYDYATCTSTCSAEELELIRGAHATWCVLARGLPSSL